MTKRIRVESHGKTIKLEGGDERGLLYGSFSLAKELANGVPLGQISDRSETPHLPFRAIKFNLPWDTSAIVRASICIMSRNDPRFWESFLDMMAENRFNALTLWNLHPFSFMIKPTNFLRSLYYEVADIQTWTNMGLHFAEKLKGAVALRTYRKTGDEAARKTAIKHAGTAMRYWDAVIAITQPLYRDMPLVHYSETNDAQRFHWKNLREAVAKDIDVARKASFNSGN